MKNRKFLREVRVLALMKNRYIVRYNSVGVCGGDDAKCWIETDDKVDEDKDDSMMDDEYDYHMNDSFTWGKESYHLNQYKEKSKGLLDKQGILLDQDVGVRELCEE